MPTAAENPYGLAGIGSVRTGATLLDTSISDICILQRGASLYAYTVSGGAGGVSAWRLTGQGLPRLVDTAYFGNLPATPAAGGMTLLGDADSSFLAVGGGNGVLARVPVQQTGGLGVPGLVTLSGLRGRIAVLTGGGPDAPLLAADTDGVLTALRSGSAGYSGAGSVAGPAGISAMTVLDINGQDRLFAASAGGQGIAGYRLPGNGGAPRLDIEFGAADGLGIATPTALESVSLMGQTYLLLAAAGSSSISVLRVGTDGTLTPCDHVIDTLYSRFAHIQTLETITVDGHVFVLASGSDDGISLFRLLPGGRLLPAGSLADGDGAALGDIRALALAQIGETVQVLAARESGAGLEVLTFSVAELGLQQQLAAAGGSLTGGTGRDVLAGNDGSDRLNGGAGDDILFDGGGSDRLRGGDGADVFVFAQDDRADRIEDFNPAEDRLDLSGFLMFYDAAQATITPVSGGARLSWRGETIELRSASGNALSPEQVRAAILTGPDRPPLIVNREIVGTDAADALDGSWGADVLAGQGSADTLIAGGGDDRLFGGNQGDRLEAQDGNDTVAGGNGPDLAYLGPGNDVFHDNAQGGAFGRDTVWAGHGNDTIEGGAGNDLFAGEWGNDVIRGGAGTDTLSGGDGADIFVFRPGDFVDRITDFTPGTDRLHLDAALWGSGLSPEDVVERFAHLSGNDVVLDFGGDVLILEDLGQIGTLADHIDIL